MIFNIASVTRTFTAALVLQLMEEGTLMLEDSLHSWFPSYPNIDSTITIRQLLNHTSGDYDCKAAISRTIARIELNHLAE